MKTSEPGQIAIRADGNIQLGMGHVMRCLSISHALRKLGGDCIWVTAEPDIRAFVSDNGFECVLTSRRFNEMDEELPVWEKLNPKVILVDSYQVTPKYLTALRNMAPLFYLDDNFRFTYPVDFIINYNFHADSFNYLPHYRPEQLFLGPRYSPLREEFQDISPITVRPEVFNALLTTGGSDNLNVIPVLLPFLAQSFPDITFHAVIGRFFTTSGQLKRLAYPNIQLHENVKLMSSLMLGCDCAISASGSTLYELCACGLPTVVFEIADNQAGLSNYPVSCGAMMSIGHWSRESSPEELFRLFPLTHERRSLMSAAASDLVDGQGAMRIAGELMKFL